MMIFSPFVVALLSLYTIFQAHPVSPLNEAAFAEKLLHVINATDGILASISAEWQLRSFPTLLKSCTMHAVAYKNMVSKYQRKILLSETLLEQKFIISFLGSSVTAGHDSLISQAFPAIVEEYMKPVFQMLKIDLLTRNLAMGNNPCMPYDMCVATYAGLDADIVHWEQTYNCGFGERSIFIEQFIRQTLFFDHRPLVVLSGSSTKNWKEKDCPSASELLTKNQTRPNRKEMELFTSSISKLVSVLNVDQKKHWGFIKPIVDKYAVAASLQLFTHDHHDRFKCQGPFRKDWGEGAVNWHPSVHGHRLRAFNHVYIWLNAYREAVITLYAMINRGNKSIESLMDELVKPELSTTVVLDKYHLQNAIHTRVEGQMETPTSQPFTEIVDGVQCFTDYMPRAYRNQNSLSSLIVSGISNSNSTELSATNHYGGWYKNIFEVVNGNNEKILRKHREKGYQDYKYTIYGSAQSGVLELIFTVKQKGYVYICETPGLRKLQHVSDNIFNNRLIMTINDTYSHKDTEGNDVDDTKGNIGYIYRRIYEICIQLDRQLQPNKYLLKLRVNQTSPGDNKIIFISTLLVP